MKRITILAALLATATTPAFAQTAPALDLPLSVGLAQAATDARAALAQFAAKGL